MIVIHAVKRFTERPSLKVWDEHSSKDKNHKTRLTYLYTAPLKIAKSDETSMVQNNFKRIIDDILQCRVASEGIGVVDEVVLTELAPFSSSVRIFLAQNGRNLARVLSGLALATHSTN